jgi:hypothetical protein
MQLLFDISSAAFATRHSSEFAGIGTQARLPHRCETTPLTASVGNVAELGLELLRMCIHDGCITVGISGKQAQHAPMAVRMTNFADHFRYRLTV